MKDQRPEAFIFASDRGTPLNLNNFLRRVIKPAGERARKKMVEEGRELAPGFLEAINHQAFRRTCATFMQRHGSVKDIQNALATCHASHDNGCVRSGDSAECEGRSRVPGPETCGKVRGQLNPIKPNFLWALSASC